MQPTDLPPTRVNPPEEAATPRANDTTADPQTQDFTPTQHVLGSTLEGQELPKQGSYLIGQQHAQGGMGEVFVALDRDLGRSVAFKRLQPRHAGRADSKHRFLNEAAITARLQHPGIVPVYGMTADTDGQPGYAMRFIEGEPLTEAIRHYHAQAAAADGTPDLQFRELLTRFIAVCKTMAYAHDQGVIHRDLKPANIMLGKYGETLVVDWGLAKQTGRQGDRETRRPGETVTTSDPQFDSVSLSPGLLASPSISSPPDFQT